uniref:Uncharacterized protein n=1 Tax=Sphaeramia orbicularis TaxID=375764 RepID=A0A673ASS5_9TELE
LDCLQDQSSSNTEQRISVCSLILTLDDAFVVFQKIEARVAADEDLKLADLLKYYLRESQAAKDLFVPQEPGSGGLRKRQQGSGQGPAKNRDVLQAETGQQLCCHKFEKISESAKQGQRSTP